MPDKTIITTLFLDIGGVLLSDGWGHDFKHQAAEKFQLDIHENDWQSTSEDLADMGLFIENNKLVHAGR